jgi:hypothetical protein
VHEALEHAVEVLRQLEVFDDISAVLGAEPLVSICCETAAARHCLHDNIV